MKSDNQVYMERFFFQPLPKVGLPLYYNISNYQDGDESIWTVIQNKTFENHKPKIFEEVFSSDFNKDGIFFATYKNKKVGIAAGIFKTTPKGNFFGVLDWVGVLKEHRGKGIGSALATEVLNYLRMKGLLYASLRTPIYRKISIDMYKKLGFKIDFSGHRDSAIEKQIIKADSFAPTK